MIRTQIQLEENQIKWLKVKAQERGVSLSQLIREGIAFYRAHQVRFPEDKKKRALEAIGRFASGVSDASERHDDYLAEAYKTEVRNGK
ncbi:MAG: CopG family transcriptional regulator [Thermodesulfobacteriota bacterium]|nr:CopG family transcriptional regulator [Thermodesulfobacteriota bacterium]